MPPLRSVRDAQQACLTALLPCCVLKICFAADWDPSETEPTNSQLWVDTWDDDSTGDDFTKQLRQELERK